MPGFKRSQSQKKSQSQSKNGGRRRKHTMRKLRRMKKSRKVMRGGELSKKYTLSPDQGMMLPKEIGELIKAGKNNTDLLKGVLLNMAMTNSTKDKFDLLYKEIVPEGLRNVNSNSEKVDQMLKVIIKHLSSDLIESKDKIDLPTFDQSKAVSPSDMFPTQYRNSPPRPELRGVMPEVLSKGLDTGFNKGEMPRSAMSEAFGYNPTSGMGHLTGDYRS